MFSFQFARALYLEGYNKQSMECYWPEEVGSKRHLCFESEINPGQTKVVYFIPTPMEAVDFLWSIGEVKIVFLESSDGSVIGRMRLPKINREYKPGLIFSTPSEAIIHCLEIWGDIKNGKLNLLC